MNTKQLIEIEWRKEEPDVVVVGLLYDILVKEMGIDDSAIADMIAEAVALGGVPVDLDD